LPIAAGHSAFAGHFPGNPIVPGVVLLDEALYAIGRMIGLDASTCQVSTVKFLSPVRPGESVSVAYEAQPDVATTGKVRFDIMSHDRKIATGAIVVPRE
jgi:3-hydroxyacyl-[acyl-carrier-protein] dehydratase